MPKLLRLAALASLPLAGCVAVAPPPPRPVAYVPASSSVPVAPEPAQYVVPRFQPVPPLIVERRPPPPVSREVLIWRPGHWVWNGATYVWNPGAYEPRMQHARWIHGHWRQGPGGYIWVPAHWG